MLEVIRMAKAAGLNVSLLPRIFDVVGSSVEFDELDGLTVLGIRRFGLSRSSRAVKRTLDLVGAGLGLLAVSPLLAAIAIDDPARQPRPGVLPPDARRPRRQALPDDQVPHDGARTRRR